MGNLVYTSTVSFCAIESVSGLVLLWNPLAPINRTTPAESTLFLQYSDNMTP